MSHNHGAAQALLSGSDSSTSDSNNPITTSDKAICPFFTPSSSSFSASTDANDLAKNDEETFSASSSSSPPSSSPFSAISGDIIKIDEISSPSPCSADINKIDEGTTSSSPSAISGDIIKIDETSSPSAADINKVDEGTSSSSFPTGDDFKENSDSTIDPKVYSKKEAADMRNRGVQDLSIYERTFKEFQFVESVYEFISRSNLAVVKGGAVRDVILNNHMIEQHHEEMQKFYRDKHISPSPHGVDEALLPVCQPVKIPRDIDCELCPIENTDMTEELWDETFVDLFRLLRDEFGKNNVHESFRVGGSHGHDYSTFLPIRVRTVVIQGNRIRNEMITVDVISPLTLENCAASSPSSSSSSSSSSPAQRPVSTIIKAEDALDLDVNGLYAKNYNACSSEDDDEVSTEKEVFQLHPRLVHLGFSHEDVFEAIRNKLFTVVAVDALLRTKRLWGRVLDRLNDGSFHSKNRWVGRFPAGPGEIIRHWKITWDGARHGNRKRCVSTIDNEDGKETINIPIKMFDCLMAEKWGSTEEDLKNESERTFALPQVVVRMSAEERHQAQIDLNDKLAKQVERLERKDSPTFINECCVCMDNDSDHIVAGCGHLCLCAGCADAVSSQHGFKCPICRVPGIRAIKVFIP